MTQILSGGEVIERHFWSSSTLSISRKAYDAREDGKPATSSSLHPEKPWPNWLSKYPKIVNNKTLLVSTIKCGALYIPPRSLAAKINFATIWVVSTEEFLDDNKTMKICLRRRENGKRLEINLTPFGRINKLSSARWHTRSPFQGIHSDGESWWWMVGTGLGEANKILVKTPRWTSSAVTLFSIPYEIFTFNAAYPLAQEM